VKQAIKGEQPRECGRGCRGYHHRTCTECEQAYSIHDEHYAFSTSDGVFHEGHIDCLAPLLKEKRQ